jgi:hypothetical protein
MAPWPARLETNQQLEREGPPLAQTRVRNIPERQPLARFLAMRRWLRRRAAQAREAGQAGGVDHDDGRRNAESRLIGTNNRSSGSCAR